MSRPTEIIAGDSYSYTVTPSDYPATDGWTLKVTIVNASYRLQVSATTNADGVSYDVGLKSTDTDDLLTAGVYAFVEAVQKGTGPTLERHTVYSGTIKVVLNATATTIATDLRSTARKMLDAIEATILANLGKGHDTLAIAARTIGYRSWDEMMRARQRLQLEIQTEETAAAVAQGLEPNRPILTRFSGIV